MSTVLLSSPVVAITSMMTDWIKRFQFHGVEAASAGPAIFGDHL